MQTEILEKNPSADVRVYAVWFDMLPKDTRQRWPADLLTDGRVKHFWDEAKVAGNWYATQTNFPRAQWDAWFLYGRDAQWGDSPPTFAGWGRTIWSTREKFRENLMKLLGESPSARE